MKKDPVPNKFTISIDGELTRAFFTKADAEAYKEKLEPLLATLGQKRTITIEERECSDAAFCCVAEILHRS
jgi:dsDNA-binding SOS-regulon protein